MHMPVGDVALGYRMHETLQPTVRIMHTAFENIPSTLYYQEHSEKKLAVYQGYGRGGYPHLHWCV